MSDSSRLAAAAAWLFVLIWSTGFVVARGISGQIDPWLFLLLRFACVLMIFLTLMLALRQALPSRRDQLRLIGIGALMQGLYLGPGFWAVSQGLEAGVMALLGTLQPPLTALLAWHFFGEQPSRRLIIGLVIGMAGVALSLAPGLLEGSDGASTAGWIAVIAALLSVASITAGTLLQKSSIVTVPLLAAISFQTLGAVLVMLLMNASFGQWQLPGEIAVIGYLAYAVLILSIGGFTLLTWLVRQGSATRASSLLLLVPPLAAVLSWLLYGESLDRIQIAGFVLALSGVLLARSSTA